MQLCTIGMLFTLLTLVIKLSEWRALPYAHKISEQTILQFEKLILHKENTAFVLFNKSEFSNLVTAFLRQKNIQKHIMHSKYNQGHCFSLLQITIDLCPSLSAKKIQDTLCSAFQHAKLELLILFSSK